MLEEVAERAGFYGETGRELVRYLGVLRPWLRRRMLPEEWFESKGVQGGMRLLEKEFGSRIKNKLNPAARVAQRWGPAWEERFREELKRRTGVEEFGWSCERIYQRLDKLSEIGGMYKVLQLLIVERGRAVAEVKRTRKTTLTTQELDSVLQHLKGRRVREMRRG